MTLTRKAIIREVGRRTRHTNQQVEEILNQVLEVLTEELAQGGRISLENFMILEVHQRQKQASQKSAQHGKRLAPARFVYHTLKVKPSKRLKSAFQQLSRKSAAKS